MSDPRGTTWDIEPHTEKKHEVLRRYLDAWIPIMAQTFGRIIYLDGFAGPGIYSDQEPGSPVIAIDRAMRHPRLAKFRAEIFFAFIEKRPDRAANLRQVLASRFPEELLRKRKMSCEVYEASFNETMNDILDSLEAEGAKIAPTFAFLDPFGFTGAPMELISRLLRYNACEVLVTFMEGFVNRFAGQVSVETLDRLYATDEWGKGLELEDPEDRKDFWLELYQEQLRSVAGATYVSSFEMINRSNQTVYFLVHGTNHPRGLEVMTEAMWRADPTGQHRFRDRTVPDQRLLLDYDNEPTWGPRAREMVWQKFKGRTVEETDIHRFVVEHVRCPYKKRVILWKLEDEGRIINRRRRHSYARGRGPIEFAP